MENNSRNMFKGFTSVGISVVLNMILGFFTTPLITRIVEPTVLGKYSIFSTYASLIIEVSFLGLNQAFSRFFYAEKKTTEKKKIINMCIFIPIVASILLILAFMFLHKIDLINIELENKYLILLMFYIISSFCNNIAMSLLTITYDNLTYSICTVIQKIVYVLSIYILFDIFDFNNLYSIVVSSSLSILLPTIVAIKRSPEYWGISNLHIPNNYREILIYSIPFIFYNFIETLFDSMNRLFVDFYCGSFDSGIFTSAQTIVGFLAIITTTFTTIWNPIQTDHYVNSPNDKEFIRKGNRYITVIMLFAGVNVILFKDLLCYLLGESYRNASQIIPFLVFSPILYTITNTTSGGIEISKRSYLYVISAVISCLFSFVSNLVFVRNLGMRGAAIATALSCVVFFITRTYFSNKYYYVDYSIRKMFIVLTCLFIFAYFSTFVNIALINIIIYVISVIVFAILYYSDIKELFMVIKDILKRNNK